MTKAVSYRNICFIKAVFFLCEHGQFSLNFPSFCLSCLPPPPILLGLDSKGTKLGYWLSQNVLNIHISDAPCEFGPPEPNTYF